VDYEVFEIEFSLFISSVNLKGKRIVFFTFTTVSCLLPRIALIDI